MKLDAERFTIKLRHPFRLAHGLSTTRETILVHLHDEERGLDAYGEGGLPPYYPSTAEACLRWLERIPETQDVSAWEHLCKSCEPGEATAGRVALEIALQDLKAQWVGKPIWQLWGLHPTEIPSCWRTLSIASSEGELRDMLGEAISAGAGRIKLKTGSGDLGWDAKCIELAAEHAGIELGLDANEGWTPEEAAQILSSTLDHHEMAFVEQPVPREAWRWEELRARLSGQKIPPLVADESLQTIDDLDVFQGLADGVNVKLLKAGGLDGARGWIDHARHLKMGVMIGVMIEIGIGRTAAAQLAPLADWLDIDPPDSIPAAPMIGFRVTGDRLMLSDRPGLGLLPVGPEG